jgi:sugar lactone lactonase YvrE
VDLPSRQVTTVFTDLNVSPTDVAVDSTGKIYFTDYGNTGSGGGRVGALAPGATVPNFIVSGLGDPSYLHLDDANQRLFVSNPGDPGEPGFHLVTQYSLPTTGRGTIVAGNGQLSGASVCPPSTGPVKATHVSINAAFGLALFGSSLFIADEYGHAVYRVALSSGQLTRYAGSCNPGPAPYAGTGDGRPATQATVPYPQGLAVDGVGNLYILQIQGQVRRVAVSTGVITTIYPGPPTCDSNTGIAFDPSDGSLYYTSQDTQNLMRLVQS